MPPITPPSTPRSTPRNTRGSTRAPIAETMPRRIVALTKFGGPMRSLLIAALLGVAGVVCLQAQDFNWHGRLAPGKRLEVKGVNGDVRAVLASGAEAVVNARKRSEERRV